VRIEIAVASADFYDAAVPTPFPAFGEFSCASAERFDVDPEGCCGTAVTASNGVVDQLKIRSARLAESLAFQ
jgi:hypothetical protein